MANNSSANVTFSLEDFSPESIGNCLSIPIQILIDHNYGTLSPPIAVSADILPIDILGPPVLAVSGISFVAGSFISFSNYVGDILVMPNVIHIGDAATLNVTTLVITDKTGRGNSSIVAPSGAAYAISGLRIGFENQTANYTVPQHKSGFTWTNVGAAGTITFTLPTGLATGTAFQFLRTGPQVNIAPQTPGRIWHSTSGLFRPAGTSIAMSTSGCKIGLVVDGSNNWYPTLEEGTIVTL